MKGRLVLLLSLFLLFLALPLFAARSYFKSDGNPQASEGEAFPSALQFARKDSHISLPQSDALNTAPGDRLLYVSWFKLRKLPREGEKIFLFSKLDGSSPGLTGYVVALTRKGEAVRPTIYWKDAHGKGGWYLFSKVELTVGEWEMFGVSFYDGRVLGVYNAPYKGSGESEISLAGGVDLEDEITPSNDAHFMVGSTDSTAFKGKVGPFCLIDLKKDQPVELLKKFAHDPLSLPSDIERKRLRFCTYDWKSDLGKHALAINYSAGNGAEIDE